MTENDEEVGPVEAVILLGVVGILSSVSGILILVAIRIYETEGPMAVWTYFLGVSIVVTAGGVIWLKAEQ